MSDETLQERINRLRANAANEDVVTLLDAAQEIISQRATLSAQAEEIARLRADKERLDWLEEMANEPGGLLLHDGSETGRRGIGLRPGHMARMLRAAIDAARAKERE